MAAAGTVPLFEGHVRRLGEDSRAALREFTSLAAPGVYRVSWSGQRLTTQARSASRLLEDMPTRLVVSGFSHQRGRFPKPAPPSPYDAVRLEGVSSLLTDASDEELFESCSAALVAWDGHSLVLPPLEAPAVASLAEAQVASHLRHRRARVLVRAHWPLLLINAVAGTCAVNVPNRPPFPREVRAQLDAVLAL